MGSDDVDLQDALSPDSSLAWTFKPAFGIIHPVSCAICRSYMTHLVVANQSCEPSFKEALSEREVRLSTAFFDGVREGRHLQQEHDIALLTRCKEERDQAVRRLEMHKELLDVAKRELDALRDQVASLQVAFDDLSHQKNVSSPAKSMRSISTGSDVSSMERLLLGSSVYLDYIDSECSTSTSKSGNDELVPTIPDHSSLGSGASRVTDPKRLGKTSEDGDSTISISISPVSFDLKTAPGTPATATASPPSPNVTPLPRPSSKPIAPAPKPFPVQHSTSVPTRTALSPKPLTTHSHLQALMKAAHAGDDHALSRVRAFCAVAHATPRDQRTELHRYVLVHWHNRSRSASDPPQPTSDGNLSVEIYVDASAWGVGFVMDGQWLAWKYADSVCYVAQSIDISWAEMLAVEVGLWTVIHWAMSHGEKQGQHLGMSIVVHCDNAGVVKAIERQYSTHPAQQEVLQRVLDLISEYDIQVTMKWISSVDNLADNPSRGVPGLGATLLSYVPPVPQYLSTILVPITNFA